MKYRKKPVVIDAMLLTPGTMVAVCQWIASEGGSFVPEMQGLGIVTLEGTMLAKHGDWIIRGVQGEFYPCKPDIFAATYEPAESGE